MRHFILLYFFLCFVLTSCQQDKEVKCTFVTMADNYPKGEIKELDYSRDICCILLLENNTKDSLYFPFYGIGHMQKSSFYTIVNNKDTIQCSASFWGKQNHTHIVAPKDKIRIGIMLYFDDIKKIENGNKIDISELYKNVRFIYKAEQEDLNTQYPTPKLTIEKADSIELVYDTYHFSFTKYRYDNALRLISVTSPNGVTEYYAYDCLDRLRKECYLDKTDGNNINRTRKKIWIWLQQ